MTSPGEICALIPVYNHSDTLRGVVEGALELLERVIVVDDGSTDAAVTDILDGLPVEIVSHDVNLGKGAALISGAKSALASGARHVIALDADGQHDPRDISLFLPLLQGSDCKIIVGERDFSSADVPFGSRFGREFSDFWVGLETGMPISDSQSGFRAYPAEFLAGFKAVFQSYAFETEILVRAAWKGYSIENVTISVSYRPEGGKRISHFSPWMDNLRLSLLHSRLVVESLFKKRQA